MPSRGYEVPVDYKTTSGSIILKDKKQNNMYNKKQTNNTYNKEIK